MEKKNKRKFWGTLTSYLLTFMLISSWAVLGIALALKSSTVNVGGDITFKSTDIQATITLDSVTGAEADSYTDKFQTITYDGKATSDAAVADAIASWTNLNLEWTDADAPVATITFTIKNTNTAHGLKVTVGPLVKGVEDNATVAAKVAGEDINADGYTVAANETLQVVITLTVLDADADASVTGWNLPITLTQAD